MVSVERSVKFNFPAEEVVIGVLPLEGERTDNERLTTIDSEEHEVVTEAPDVKEPSRKRHWSGWSGWSGARSVGISRICQNFKLSRNHLSVRNRSEFFFYLRILNCIRNWFRISNQYQNRHFRNISYNLYWEK
jgi:hypothetical protein